MADGDLYVSKSNDTRPKADQNLIVNDEERSHSQRSRTSFLDFIHRLTLADVLPSRRFSEFNQWPIFMFMESSLLAKIKRFCVFSIDNDAMHVIFLTDDGDVYAQGTNENGCLGLGLDLVDDVSCQLEPRKIEALCQKNVTDISFGIGNGPHVLAVTEAGEVFSWGPNNYCQLGNGTSAVGVSPVIVATNLETKKVVKVACGSGHSMALTSEGEVFAWGHNCYGQVGTGTSQHRLRRRAVVDDSQCQLYPHNITGLQGLGIAISIACGNSFSMVLMSGGRVYGWGYNGHGQLGIDNTNNQSMPCVVHALKGTTVSQVICGANHTLALTDEGEVFSWGENSYGQCGTGSQNNLTTPNKVFDTGERFVEVAASHYSNISVAQNETGKVYMWGQCRNQAITQPKVTHYSTTDDVFAIISQPSVSWRMFHVDKVKRNGIVETMTDVFDHPESSDFRFIIEGKTVHVHKTILQIRCEYFRSMFRSCWDEAKKDSIEITEYSYNVYRAFLKFLYTDKVDLQAEEAIDLLDLSNAYVEEVLKMKCEAIIWQGISVENAAMLYAAAIKFGAKDLEDFCFRFFVNHMTAVVQTEAYAKVDDAVIKDFMYKASFAKAFKH